jgi:predicted MFS family arabinose efflux permease
VKSPLERASLLVLGVAAFLVSADARVIDPLLRVIADDFGVKVASASLIVSAYTLPYGLFQLVYGPLGDRIGKLRVMAGTLALFALGTAACALVSSTQFLLLALLRFVTGAVAAALIPLSLGYIGDKVPYEGRQVALARFMSALMLGQILSNTLGGIFGQYLGWRGIFLVFGGAALVAAAALWRESQRFPEPQRPDRRFTLAPYLALIGRPDARLILTAVFVEGFFVFGGLAFLGASLKDRFAFLRYDQIGLMLAGYGIGGLAYSFFVRRFVARLGERGIVILGGTLLAIAYLTIAWLPNIWLFLPAIIVFGMGYFTMHGTLQTKATELSPEARGTAVSLFAFCFFIGQALGALAIGRLIGGAGYPVGFATCGIGLAVLALWTQTQLQKPSVRP